MLQIIRPALIGEKNKGAIGLGFMELLRVLAGKVKSVLMHRDIGSYGDLIIPMVRIKEPLYLADGEDVKTAAGDKNSAVVFWFEEKLVVADYSGCARLWKLKDVVPYGTMAELRTKDGDGAYVCTKVMTGYIRRGESADHVYDKEGVLLRKIERSDLWIYTAIGESNGVISVCLTQWKLFR